MAAVEGGLVLLPLLLLLLVRLMALVGRERGKAGVDGCELEVNEDDEGK